jgi:hypothetical protein
MNPVGSSLRRTEGGEEEGWRAPRMAAQEQKAVCAVNSGASHLNACPTQAHLAGWIVSIPGDTVDTWLLDFKQFPVPRHTVTSRPWCNHNSTKA